MRLQRKGATAPFPEESVHHAALLPSVGGLLLAVASIFLLVLAAVKVRNLAVAVSDETRVKALERKVAELTAESLDTAKLQKAAGEVRELSARLAAQAKDRDEAKASIATIESALDKAIKAIRAGAKDKKARKAADAKIKKLKDESARQLASLKERREKLSKDMQRTNEILGEKVKAMALAAATPSQAADAGASRMPAAADAATAKRPDGAPGGKRLDGAGGKRVDDAAGKRDEAGGKRVDDVAGSAKSGAKPAAARGNAKGAPSGAQQEGRE